MKKTIIVLMAAARGFLRKEGYDRKAPMPSCIWLMAKYHPEAVKQVLEHIFSG